MTFTFKVSYFWFQEDLEITDLRNMGTKKRQGYANATSAFLEDLGRTT